MSNENIANVRGRIAPNNLETSYLLSAGYDGQQKKAFVRLYEPKEEQIYLWYDNSGHLPYLVSKGSAEELSKNNSVIKHQGFVRFDESVKYDALIDQNFFQ